MQVISVAFTWILRRVYWATKKSPAALLHRASQMKPPGSKKAKKSVTFQQLRFQYPKLIYSQFESHTNNLLFKKNLVRIGFPYQKLLNFNRNKSKFPTVWSNFACKNSWFMTIEFAFIQILVMYRHGSLKYGVMMGFFREPFPYYKNVVLKIIHRAPLRKWLIVWNKTLFI
jgi:hypothetical protein